MKTTFKKYLTPVVSLAVLMLAGIGIAFASPAYYTPGQTLVPTCPPGGSVSSVPCTVETIGYNSAGNVNPIVTGSASSSDTGFDIQNSALTDLFKIANNGAITIDGAYTLPTTDGSANQVLQTDGSGNVTWQTSSGGGAEAVQTLKVHLTPSEIDNLNTSPVQLIPAPGAGKIIQVLAVTGNMTFNTTPYSTNTNKLSIIDTASGNAIFNDTGHDGSSQDSLLLDATTNAACQFSPQGAQQQGESTQITPDSSVSITVPNGNPTSGDSPIDIYLTYQVITL